MVCNTENSIYQVPIVGSSGVTKGLFRLSESACEMAPNDRVLRRIWRGIPSARHVEKLVLTKDHDGKRGFGLLIEEPDGHWMRDVSHQKAASWLIDRDYDLPDQLRHLSSAESDPKDHARRAEHPEQTPSPVHAPVATRSRKRGLRRLTRALVPVWNLLDGKQFLAREIAEQLGPGITEDTVRKRIEAIKHTCRKIIQEPGCGYYRPDAPPPQ